jgi:hypothetical protein
MIVSSLVQEAKCEVRVIVCKRSVMSSVLLVIARDMVAAVALRTGLIRTTGGQPVFLRIV